MSKTSLNSIHILSIDTYQMDSEELRRFVVFLKNLNAIRSWHSPYIGSFFLIVEGSLEPIHESISEYFAGDRAFFLGTIQTYTGWGDLSEETWDWCEENNVRTTALDQ